MAGISYFEDFTHAFPVEPWIRRLELLARVGQELLEDTILV